MRLNANEFMDMSTDDFDSVDKLSRTRISRKEIKSKWQQIEEGVNLHSGKSVSRQRKW